MKWRTVNSSVFLIVIVLLVILVPFFFFHEYFDGWTADLLKTSSRHPVYTAAVLCILLASDIVLPVPSSIISTGAGFLLGFFYGTIVSFAGMTLGCLIGYVLGKGSGRVMRWLDIETRLRMERFFKRSGKWAIIIARPIPVLAEATVFFAGISKMNFTAFAWTTSLSNLGISMVYATVGSYSISVNSVLLAFSGAILLPAAGFLFEKLYLSKRSVVH
jgi:uncharacterized membrane protein YdjX (TVP38/TMEM64 family)